MTRSPWLLLLIPTGAFMFSLLTFSAVERMRQHRPWMVQGVMASLGLALFTFRWVVLYDFTKGCRWID